MPLQAIQTTSETRAEQVASQLVNLISSTSSRIKTIRTNGLPAVPERTLPNGQIVPAQPAVSGAEIDAKLGPSNVAIIDSLTRGLE